MNDELIPRHIDSEGRNWGRWCIVDGESPVPSIYTQQPFVRYMRASIEWGHDDDPIPQPPIDYRAARNVNAFYKSLEHEIERHVMCSFWVGNYIYGRPRTEHETVRLLNSLVQAKRLDVPEGYQFTLHSYRADIVHIAKRMEAAFEICA